MVYVRFMPVLRYNFSLREVSLSEPVGTNTSREIRTASVGSPPSIVVPRGIGGLSRAITLSRPVDVSVA